MEVKEVQSLLSAIDDLIDIKVLIRNIVPNYKLDPFNKSKLIDFLLSLEDKLFPIFSKYLNQDLEVKNKKGHRKIKNKILSINQEKSLLMVSANSSKKKLKNIGIDPRIILVTGGPLKPEDYKIINPNLPEKALINIEKKCKRVFEEIEKNNRTDLELYFIYEPENITDKLILSDLDKIRKIIGDKIILLQINSWNELDL